MKLTTHFTFEELIGTNTGIVNDPEKAFNCVGVIVNISRMALVLQAFRDYINSRRLLIVDDKAKFNPVGNRETPIIVNSCYRCRELNTFVGGKPNSHHLYALAFDIRTSCHSSSDLIALWYDFIESYSGRDTFKNCRIDPRYSYKIDDYSIHCDFDCDETSLHGDIDLSI